MYSFVTILRVFRMMCFSSVQRSTSRNQKVYFLSIFASFQLVVNCNSHCFAPTFESKIKDVSLLYYYAFEALYHFIEISVLSNCALCSFSIFHVEHTLLHYQIFVLNLGWTEFLYTYMRSSEAITFYKLFARI